MSLFEFLFSLVQSMPNSKRQKTKVAQAPPAQNDIANESSETAVDEDTDRKVRLDTPNPEVARKLILLLLAPSSCRWRSLCP